MKFTKPTRTLVSKSDSGVIEVALAIAALCVVVLFSSYVLEITATLNRYQTGLSEATRNVARAIQQGTQPIGVNEIRTIALATFTALDLNTSSLQVLAQVSGTCRAEQVTISISEPLLPKGQISSSTTQTAGLNTGSNAQCQ